MAKRAALSLRTSDLTDARERANRQERYREDSNLVAGVLVRAAQAGLDVGELLAGACRAAAAELDGAVNEIGTVYGGGDALVAARPGSWESDLVLQLAAGWDQA